MQFLPPTESVVRLQLAVDGRWETALHVAAHAIDETAVVQWLRAASQNLALEAFVAVLDGEAFFGIRLTALERDAQHELVRLVVREISVDSAVTAATLVRKIEALTGVSLLTADPAFLELGKVNAWQSFGSIVFWPDDPDRTMLDCFHDALASHPKFLESSDLPYAVEFAFEGTFPHWCGMPVSVVSGGRHTISPSAAEKLLAPTPPDR